MQGDIVDEVLGGGRIRWKDLPVEAVESAVSKYQREHPQRSITRQQVLERLQQSIRNKRHYAKKHGLLDDDGKLELQVSVCDRYHIAG